MTSLLTLVVQPVGTAALSRMPHAIESLAVWQVVTGFVFLLRSMGLAYNEVVITLLDEPHSWYSLRRFTTLLATLTIVLLLIVAATPLAAFWFGRVSALDLRLIDMARRGLWIALPMPALNVVYSWYQGALVRSRHTRGVTEAVVIYLLISSLLLWIGVRWGQMTGLYVGLAAFGIGTLAQTAWLWYRSRPAMRAVLTRDATAVL
jgi:uncharacterized membrane protein